MFYLYCVICFFLELVTSYLANWANVSIISRKPKKAIYYGFANGLANWAILFIIGKLSDWNIPIMIVSVIGNATGDYIVANRKLKPKTKASIYRKKTPFTSA